MKQIKEKILLNSYNLILEDWKLVKLATFTTIFHSLVFTIYIIYQVIFFIENIGQSDSISENQNIIQVVTDYLKALTEKEYFFITAIFVIILVLIWYFLLPPVAEASLIYYLESKKVWKALKVWLKKFFPMFEFHWIISIFSFLAFFIVLSRVYILWILINPLIITILVFWFIAIIIQSILLPYVKFLIVLENLPIKEAIKKSINLSLENLWLTFKFVIINYLLYLRFIINTLLIIGLPIFILRIISTVIKNLGENTFFRYFFYTSIVLWILLTTYINWIIEAFFITYWYKVYEHIKDNDNW